ncbi:MAG: hypothetical protein ACLQU2_09555 [Candidatus Binataceae bacterium]
MTAESVFLNRPQLIPLLSLTGVVLDALGGMYLAYDLLGGRQGPLRLLSRVLTYSAIFGLGYGATLGLWFGLAGALISGPSIEIQLARRSQGIDPSRTEWALMAALRGLSFGVAGWLAVGHDFGIAFGILCAFAMHIAYEFGFGMDVFRAYQKPRLHRRLLIPGIVRGIMIGVAGALSGALTGRPEALLYGIQIGLVVGTLNTTVTILSPPVEWWADNLPDRALGGYGAVLVLIGSALQTVQYVMPLISR